MVKAGIIGATGYAGIELVRILLRHPDMELTAVSSVSFEGKTLSEVYPTLREICDMICTTAADVVEKSDVVFAALPHGLSQETAEDCAKAGKKFIDLGADFRLDDPAEYENGTAARWCIPSSMNRRCTVCRSCSGNRFKNRHHRESRLLSHQRGPGVGAGFAERPH